MRTWLARLRLPFDLRLLQRLVVGTLVGFMYKPDPDDVRTKIFLISAVLLAMTLYVIVVRPFLVRAANVFEALVLVFQAVVVLLNLGLLAGDGGAKLLASAVFGRCRLALLWERVRPALRALSARRRCTSTFCRCPNPCVTVKRSSHGTGLLTGRVMDASFRSSAGFCSRLGSSWSKLDSGFS